MKNLTTLFVVATLALYTADATIVQDCKTGAASNDTSLVKISDCENPACRLRRKHDVMVEAKFKTTTEVKTLRNTVSALILGIAFPFIGVDGTSACNNIFSVDGTQVSCPLAADTEYVYKNSFKVLEIYPKLKTSVHWALTDPNNVGNDPLCFKVNVKITA